MTMWAERDKLVSPLGPDRLLSVLAYLRSPAFGRLRLVAVGGQKGALGRQRTGHSLPERLTPYNEGKGGP